MPHYARFDPLEPEPQIVSGWYDTDRYTYANLPGLDCLIEVPADIWDTREDHHAWHVEGGKIVAAPPHPALALEAKLAEGVQVTSQSHPEINGTYPFHAALTMAEAARDVLAGAGLPGFHHPVGDINGRPIDVPEEILGKFYIAIRNLRAGMYRAYEQKTEYPDQRLDLP